MSPSTNWLRNLRDALDPNHHSQRGMIKGIAHVRRDDLRELLHHFDRLDADARHETKQIAQQQVKSMSIRHPIQPLQLDPHGVIRFKENKIVRALLSAGPLDLNSLARMDFEREDHEQLAQLIGYSLSGFSELSYVSDETYDAADDMAEQLKRGSK